MTEAPNHPAAGKAGIAPRLAIGHHCPGLPEPGRWTAAFPAFPIDDARPRPMLPGGRFNELKMVMTTLKLLIRDEANCHATITRGLVTAVLFLVMAWASSAEELVIQSFDRAGHLSFSALSNAASYRVEWAPSPAGPWSTFSGAAGALDNIPATNTTSLTCTVPMCYRVVATVTPWSPNYGFERWVSGTAPAEWTVDVGIAAAREISKIHEGASSVSLTRNSANPVECDIVATGGGDFPVSVGSAYNIVMWIWDSDLNTRGGISYAWYQADHTTLVGTVSYGTGYTYNLAAWQVLVLGTAPAPAGAAFLRVGLRLYGEGAGNLGGFVYLDDISIAPL